jgi:hypothetical protein
MKFILALLLFPFLSSAQINCDTLFVSQQVTVSYAASLDSLGFDSSAVECKFHSPTGFLYKSKLSNDDGYYRLAFFENGKWKSWSTSIADVEFGDFAFNWKDVDGKGKSELVLWEFHVFGHHAATHAEEYTAYSVYIWNIEDPALLFMYNYKNSEWYDDMDMHNDSNRNQAPPYVTDEYSDVAISTNSVTINVKRDTHNGEHGLFFENENLPAHASVDKREIEEIDPSQLCPKAEGTYVFHNGAWIKNTTPVKTRSPALHPPDYHPYWEHF